MLNNESANQAATISARTLIFVRTENSFWIALGVCAVSIIVTLIFWFILPATYQINENSDYLGLYEPLARNILAGRGFILDGMRTGSSPPAYPVLLAGVFGLAHLLNVPESNVLSAFILVCGGLSSICLFLVARSVWGLRAGLVTSLLWISYPVALWLTKQPNSEIAFTPVFYAGFGLFLLALVRKTTSWSVYLIAGLLIGVAMLIRPIAIGTGFVMGALLLVVAHEKPTRLRLLLATMVLAGTLVPVLPWELWLYSTTNKVILISGHGPMSIRDGLTFAATGGSRPVGGFSEDVMSLMRDMSNRGDEMQSLGGVIAVIKDEFQSRPLAVAKLLVIKVMRSWYGTDSRRYEVVTMLIQVPYFLLILWGTMTAWKRGGVSRQLSVGIWAIVLYFWGMTVLVVPILRYMTPVMGLLFLLIPASFARPPHLRPSINPRR